MGLISSVPSFSDLTTCQHLHQMQKSWKDNYLFNRTITQYWVYQSSLEVSKNKLIKIAKQHFGKIDGLLTHLEVVYKVGEFDYVLLSFSDRGLSYCNSTDRNQLAKHRENNIVIENKEINVSGNVLARFLTDIPFDKKSYSVTSWNCWHFTIKLIKDLNPDSPFVKKNYNLFKILNNK